MRHAWRILAAATGYIGIGILISWPLVRHLSDALPGPPKDNLAFLWNFWWMREALAAGASPFFTPSLFIPAGVDLTLNTNTPLPAFLGATVLGHFDIVSAQNLMTIAALALNGFAAFLLARHYTRDDAAAFVGGVIFAMSSYITSRLLGHLNLTSAFVLPLFALAWTSALRGSKVGGLAAGLVLGATIFIDYYYLVYAGVLAMCLIALTCGEWRFIRAPESVVSRRTAWTLFAITAALAVLIVVIAVTGGMTMQLVARRVSMHSTYNPRQIFWMSLLLLMLAILRPRVRARWSTTLFKQAIGPMAVAALVFLITASPMIWLGAHMIARGDYVSQTYFWRSAPAGVDVSTIVLGNPMHPLWGQWPGTYDASRLDQAEQLGWLGVVPVVLMVIAIRHCRHEAAVRTWLTIGVIFFIWALGPHLVVMGFDTGLILPETLLRYVPIAANARLPQRAIVLSHLALAILAAFALARWPRGRPIWLAPIVAGVVAFEQLPAPFPLLTVDHPAIYDTLRARAERGGVCELPLGWGDGLGEAGALDRRVMFYQSIHGRPIAGGFISRLPTSVRAIYEHDALLTALTDLSGSTPKGVRLPGRDEARAAFQRDEISFVMLDRLASSSSLIDYVEHTLPLVVVARDGRRTLYRVDR